MSSQSPELLLSSDPSVNISSWSNVSIFLTKSLQSSRNVGTMYFSKTLKGRDILMLNRHGPAPV
jgi:hypothetical protein